MTEQITWVRARDIVRGDTVDAGATYGATPDHDVFIVEGVRTTTTTTGKIVELLGGSHINRPRPHVLVEARPTAKIAVVIKKG